ncbi:DUF2325 domain-containing protein [Rhizobium lusitanum]|uniref:DUF2325 domain-containing protein n=1 Tax=Rhizobium lusitanum TaxID=293958 RepID=A0A6L9U9T4_9HYPH|nr:DUF2325 domain-containing protein [Rhizobium lusitanum]NEI72139.1 DUF2325 domain-containing protein [Rhizobium lusitanum]
MTILLNHKRVPGLTIADLNPSGTIVKAVDADPPAKSPRLRTWELPSMFHCSIVGTCLTTGELRQVLAKIGDIDAKSASDHALHSRGVRAAGQRDIAGKLLNKSLDKRHERIIKRFSRLSTADQIKRQWNEAVDDGDIAGAYWAVMSHPVSDRALIQEVFGEVHMLSHLVGSSSRLDIARLRKLQLEVEAKDEKIARQEERIRVMSEDRAGLQNRVGRLETSLLQARALLIDAPQASDGSKKSLNLLAKMDAAQERAEELAARLSAMEARLAEAERRASQFAEQNRVLQHELDLVADLVEPAGVQGSVVAPNVDVAVLYVGGRPGSFDRIGAIGERRGVQVLFHDGGMEDNLSLLPALVGQAVSVVFPVDCISHSAAGIVKRLCRESGKRYVPIRSASLASFLAAVESMSLTAG